MADTAALLFGKFGKFMLTDEDVAGLLDETPGTFRTKRSAGIYQLEKPQNCQNFHLYDVAEFIDSRQVSAPHKMDKPQRKARANR